MVSLPGRIRTALLLAAAAAFLLTPALAAFSADTTAEGSTPTDTSNLIYSWVPPKPGVSIDSAILASHTVSAMPDPRAHSGKTPMAAFDPTKGDIKAIVILAEFSDVPHGTFGQAYYDNKLNYNGTSQTSARTWYYENSLGNFTLQATVVGWVTLPHTQAWYDQSYSNEGHLGADAAIAANSLVDFTQFSQDGNSYVDNLVVIHSGGDEAAGCSPNCIWSKSRGGSTAVLDGMVVGAGFCTIADFGYPSGDSLGVWIHEFGHLALGLPDLYDIYYENDGLGIWDMMAAGSWYLNHFSTWVKEWLGWIDPFVPTFNVDTYTIYPPTDPRYNPVKVTTNYTNEYFLIEMRADTSTRYDAGIPNDGLLIEHIDTTRVASGWNYGFMYDVNHKAIDIEEVGTQDMDTYGGSGYSNDVWVNNFAGFNPTSTPNTNLYVNNGNYATGIRIWNISTVITAGGKHMTFSIDTGRVNYGLTGRVLGAAEKNAAPGSTVTYPIEFSTFSVAGDTINLQIEGVNQTLGTIDRSQLVLPPTGSATVNLTVTVPDFWAAGDTGWVQVRGTSAAQSQVTFLVPTVTHASQTYGVDAIETAGLDFWATPDVTYRTSFTVRNLGNGVDNVTVAATADPALVQVQIVTDPGVMQRLSSTAVPIEFTVAHNVPYLATIPVQITLRYGPSTGYLYAQVSATIHVDKLSLVSVEVQAVGTQMLFPQTMRHYNITVHNLGNYEAFFNLSTTAPNGVTAQFDLAVITVPAFSDGVMGVVVVADRDAAAWSTGLVWFTARYSDVVVANSANLSVQVLQRFEMALTGDTMFSGPPGSNAQFNLVAVNNGNGADIVAVTFSPQFAEWSPVLSTTSIALDSSLSGHTAQFQFSASVPPGAAGNLRQTFVVQLRSNASGVTTVLELEMLVLPVYAFEVQADPAQGPISASESASFLLTFRNRGNIRDSYSVTIDGLPDGWSTEFAEGGIATVAPKGTGQATLIVRPPAGAASDRYDFQIFVSSEGNLSRPIAIPLNVTILAVRGIEIRSSTVSGEITPGATITLSVVVKNTGNVRETIFFQSTGAFGSTSVDPVQVSVPPFEERVVQVFVVLRDNQAAGSAPLVIQASEVNHGDVTAETTVDITVGQVPTAAPTTPGFEVAAVIAALVAAAALVAGTRRRRL